MIRFIGALFLTTIGFVAPLSATPFLVGAQIYASGADGANTGAYSGTPYQFSTNTGVLAADLLVNGAPVGSVFGLATGDNVFTFDNGSPGYPISTIGLNLFFNDTGVSFNPPYDAGIGIPGDLAAFTVADTGVFATPVAGTDVQSFNSAGLVANSTSYSGASVFTVANWEISIAEFESSTAPSGSFTVRVANVPEPGTTALLGLGLAALIYRRKKN